MRDWGIPEVVGDPAGMRALARQLRADADRVRSLSRSADGLVQGAKMEGPAAKRMRKRSRSTHGDVGGVANRLHDLAAHLEHEAAEVERKQDARRRQIARLEQQAKDRGGRR